jgi:ornithine carbamoyltransferase
MAHFKGLARDTGATLTVTEDVDAAVKGADFVYTDVWLSMGEDEAEWGKRIELLTPYRITSAVMAASGNPYLKFMHCLPAFHNTETSVGADIQKRFGIDCMEVTEEVFESSASIVFDQAENRMHSIKAIFVATIGG